MSMGMTKVWVEGGVTLDLSMRFPVSAEHDDRLWIILVH
jgi:hypothetical protein